MDGWVKQWFDSIEHIWQAKKHAWPTANIPDSKHHEQSDDASHSSLTERENQPGIIRGIGFQERPFTYGLVQ